MQSLFDTLASYRPSMAVIVTGELPDSELTEIQAAADVVEFRADKYPSCDIDYLVAAANRLAGKPLLATIRLWDEGGEWAHDDDRRLDVYSALIPHVDGVDVEIGSRILPKVVELAHEQDKTVVASHHDFKTTPTHSRFERLFSEAQASGADFTKFATTVNDREENARLSEFTLRHRDDRIITVAMQGYGPLSRIALMGLGLRLTYAPSGDEVVKGQLHYKDLRLLIDLLYPKD